MTQAVPLAALAALLGCGAWAEPAADSPVFEVASVKPSPPLDRTRDFNPSAAGGPGTPDPTRIDFRNYSLFGLVVRAYHLPFWQLSAPDWIKVEKYDIAARIPPGATEEQFRLMLQRLLAERLGLRVHRETKELPLYSLIVPKNGPKLRPHVEPPPAGAEKPLPDGSGRRVKSDSDGYPILARGGTMAIANDKARYRRDDTDLAPLVVLLSDQLGSPVRDDTGLQGKYDIALFWSMQPLSAQPDADSGPNLFAAVQEQLGLKLEKAKGPVEILVVDHAEKVPTGN
jgi:uncharacterized protein (TIGR03435 family)